jgi:hypothetical protein
MSPPISSTPGPRPEIGDVALKKRVAQTIELAAEGTLASAGADDRFATN